MYNTVLYTERQNNNNKNQACVRKLVSYNNQIFVLIPLVVF